MMNLKDVGEVIATRDLTLDKSGKVTVLVGKPQPCPDGVDWYCPHQKVGIGSGNVKCAFGVDPVQALVLALSMLGGELYCSTEYVAGRLSWDCGAIKGDLGFPVTPNIQSVLPGNGSQNRNQGTNEPSS